MKPNADVVYRDLDTSPALNDVIYKKMEKLHRYSDSIIHSKVVLDSPHNQKHKGKLYRASIEIGLKGHPLTVSQDAPNVHIAVRDAFAAAERKIKEDNSKRRPTRH
ncbi:HPF/RaiA family ribosome-associated protein [Saccharophagus degradans]|uniref:HPF/RaiA family ribosome-associated protein n=2 Tax=Saccharophagus degradans TaxID=86304 RepID=A0AAW7X1V3_9GAMM|nr:HPF/RaiA family ribosome-associated protein [Saccharophagus degradans]ABD80861.1 putative sigma 54 modulation protein/ribosomal protein S30EA [Saccharophagus degradans 2-40]MBU2987142.1 HPF/RaiA family ribosome-associated protein [Saccharophagus degradans]MDO6421725.1 HPF/RaiA family ribosome-associated protein [Saccharophagus degradans]MDO6606581.1 HPF/RaiA family ribosome-associated protein [Saccharophagus degradans]WGO96952.1 HPF/RaiA family ribosome-associated protein [Saccharophagus de